MKHNLTIWFAIASTVSLAAASSLAISQDAGRDGGEKANRAATAIYNSHATPDHQIPNVPTAEDRARQFMRDLGARTAQKQFGLTPAQSQDTKSTPAPANGTKAPTSGARGGGGGGDHGFHGQGGPIGGPHNDGPHGFDHGGHLDHEAHETKDA